MDRHSEHGNVLFLILIAVALFAALSYAVTQSSRSGGGSIERQKNDLDVSRILNYTTSVSAGVTRLLASGCRVEQLDFDNPDDNYNNPYSPADNSCHVFHPNGAGVIHINDPFLEFKTFGPIAWEYSGHNQVVGLGTDNPNASSNELIMSMENLEESICLAINKRLGIPSTPALPVPVENDTEDDEFWGTFVFSAIIGDAPDAASLQGQYSGCLFENDGTPEYFFYHVLVAR